MVRAFGLPEYSDRSVTDLRLSQDIMTEADMRQADEP